MPRYSGSIVPSSVSHELAPGGKTTLCGLPAIIFGQPILPEYEPWHPHCKTCDSVARVMADWAIKAPAEAVPV